MPSLTPPSRTSGAASEPGNVEQTCPQSTTELEIELVTDDGYYIPEATYVLRVVDGPTRAGILDRDGRATVKGLPPGRAFALSYPDGDDIRAKAYAARLDAAIAGKNLGDVLGILALASNEVRAVARALIVYFGRDLEADCRATFTAEVDAMAVAHCLHLAGYVGGRLRGIDRPRPAKDAHV